VVEDIIIIIIIIIIVTWYYCVQLDGYQCLKSTTVLSEKTAWCIQRTQVSSIHPIHFREECNWRIHVIV